MLGCKKMISSLLSTEICVHVIKNEIRDDGVERDAGWDEEQFIKSAGPCFPKSVCVVYFCSGSPMLSFVLLLSQVAL